MLRTFQFNRFVWLLLLVGFGVLFPCQTSFAQDKDSDGKRPVLFITLESPLDARQAARLKNAALTLQRDANQRNQEGLLFLEIPAGISDFYQVISMADFLTDALPNVATVAWVPESVTGNNVILALACRDIVMPAEVQIGDISRGEILEADKQVTVLNIVSKSRNNRVSRALVEKMMNKNVKLLRITEQQAPGENVGKDPEVVTETERKRREEQKIKITKTEIIKADDSPGVFSGQEARKWEILIKYTAGSLNELAALYQDVEPSDLREDPSIAGELKVRLIKIEGTIEPGMAAYILRLINRAVADGANVIIFEVDSEGGYVESMWDLSKAITDLDTGEKKVRTIAYVPKLAMSAAAMITFSCDEVYLHPDAIIGDAGPITIREGQGFEFVAEKQLSAIRASLSALAKKKGLPPVLLEAMADLNLVVHKVQHKTNKHIWYISEEELQTDAATWTDLGIVKESKKGSLLTVTGQRAHELQLAEPTVTDFDELKQRLGIPAETKVEPMKESWVDTLIFKLNSPGWTGTLFTIAMVCLFIELHLMSGILAIISAMCFALFFWARYMGGTAGWLEVILFVGGLICLALEIFVIPGFGVFGIFGGLMVLFSLILASQTFGDPGNGGRDMQLLSQTVKTLTLSIGAVVLIAAIINRYLPHIPLFNSIILRPPNMQAEANGPQLRLGADGYDPNSQFAELYGQVGVAQSVLRPAGKARIGDRMVDVISNGPYIQAGAQIEVVEIAGNRVVVREV